MRVIVRVAVIAVIGALVAAAAVGSRVAADPAPESSWPGLDPCALVVVVDQSPALTGARLDAVKHAVVDVLGTLAPGDQVAVIGSGRTLLEAFQSWERQVKVRPDLMRFA